MEEDFVVGTVLFDSVEESLLRKLALDRLRSSLKKVMMVRTTQIVLKDQTRYAFGKSDPSDGGWLLGDKLNRVSGKTGWGSPKE